MLIAERFMPLGGSEQLDLKKDALKPTLHECGHAFDRSLGMPSDGDAFKAAYQADVSCISGIRAHAILIWSAFASLATSR